MTKPCMQALRPNRLALLLRHPQNNRRYQLIDMTNGIDQVPHFGHVSNSGDGPASSVDHENAVFVDLVYILRTDLARSPGCSRFHWYEKLKRIRNMEILYDRGLFYRAVIESCNQELGHGDYLRDLALRHLLPREYFLATVINEYLRKHDLTHATEKICSLHSSEIQQIKGIYPSLFGRELEDDLETFTFGIHRKLLLKHIGVPHGNAGVGEERLENTVRYLHKKVRGPRWAIMDLVYELNEEDLRIAVDRYSTEYRRPLVKDLMLEGYEHFEYGLVTKIQCAMNRPKYSAEKLYEAFGAMRDPNIEGYAAHCETIVRVITTVAERDMIKMKEEYRMKSGRALENDISEAFADRQDCLQLILMILNVLDILDSEYAESIRNMSRPYDQGLFNRADIESCKQEYGNDNDIRVPHFEHGSNLVDGPAPMVDDENVAMVGDENVTMVEGLVNNVRPLLRRSSGIHEHDWDEIIKSIRCLGTRYDGKIVQPGSF